MKSIEDTYKLNNGLEIPCVGYGTFNTPDEEVEKAVLTALEIGYKHVDTAFLYANEVGIGKAIKKCGIPREELFITSKLWNTNRGYESTKEAFKITLNNLGLEYLDLYLVHWPANRLQFGDEAKKINADTWRAMEELYEEGYVKAIGVSNFLTHHLEELMEGAKIKPMVNQIEFHPGWLQEDTVKYCKDQNIIIEAWSPLGRNEILENDNLIKVADKYNKSTAQLCIRWILQKGILPLPKSVTPSRIKENTEVFNFVIEEEDMQFIDSLQFIGGRCVDSDTVPF